MKSHLRSAKRLEERVAKFLGGNRTPRGKFGPDVYDDELKYVCEVKRRNSDDPVWKFLNTLDTSWIKSPPLNRIGPERETPPYQNLHRDSDNTLIGVYAMINLEDIVIEDGRLSYLTSHFPNPRTCAPAYLEMWLEQLEEYAVRAACRGITKLVKILAIGAPYQRVEKIFCLVANHAV